MRQPDPANALNAVHTLDLLIEFFDGGKNWTQRRYENRGQRCLLGALNWICEAASTPQLNRNTAEFYLLGALPPARAGVWLPLIRFNDTRKNYGQLLQFLEKARTLAQADVAPGRGHHGGRGRRNPEAKAVMRELEIVGREAKRRAKRPADRQPSQRSSTRRSGCTSAVIHAEFALTER